MFWLLPTTGYPAGTLHMKVSERGGVSAAKLGQGARAARSVCPVVLERSSCPVSLSGDPSPSPIQVSVYTRHRVPHPWAGRELLSYEWEAGRLAGYLCSA